jgi:hypothetical protein
MRPKTPRFWPEMKTRRGFGAFVYADGSTGEPEFKPVQPTPGLTYQRSAVLDAAEAAPIEVEVPVEDGSWGFSCSDAAACAS